MINDYTNIIETDGEFAFFKFVGSSNNFTSLIWVSDDDLKPQYQDWVDLAKVIVNDTKTAYLQLKIDNVWGWYTVPKIKGALMQTQNLKMVKSQKVPESWHLMIRRSGVGGNSPRKWKGTVDYPKWFVDFIFNGGDIPQKHPIAKPSLKVIR